MKAFVLYFDAPGGHYHASNVVIRPSSPIMIDIDGGGRPEFVTRNAAFNWLQPMGDDERISPLQIFRYADGQLVDVTAEYPMLIEADANFWLAAISGQDLPLASEYLELMNADLDGWRQQSLCGVESIVFSTYMYDMILLNRAAEACREIEAYYEQTEGPICSNVVTGYSENGDFCTEFTYEISELAEMSRADP